MVWGYVTYWSVGGPISLRYAVGEARDRPDDASLRSAHDEGRTDAEDDLGLCWPEEPCDDLIEDAMVARGYRAVERRPEGVTLWEKFAGA